MYSLAKEPLSLGLTNSSLDIGETLKPFKNFRDAFFAYV